MKTFTTLDQIPAGARITVDANIFIYHFTGKSRDCHDLLLRCQSREVTAEIPCHTALEVLHRLMTIESVVAGVTGSGNIARKLAEKPERVRSLTRCHAEFAALSRLGVTIVDTTVEALGRVSAICLRHGLLANDAALVAVMETRGVGHLATADSNLLGLPHIQSYLPGDLE
jgi:predicted nucleic acid-binding protein